MKQSEQKTLENIKNIVKKNEENINFEKNINLSIKQKIDFKKEYYEKSKNKFKIDKEIYFKIKNEITNGERNPNNLPILFIDEFNFFTQLEQQSILDLESSDQMFIQYLKFKPEKQTNFNTSYDNIFNSDNKYNHNSDSNSDNDLKKNEI